jgi:macrolide transport system ATP-binding/permease protein
VRVSVLTQHEPTWSEYAGQHTRAAEVYERVAGSGGPALSSLGLLDRTARSTPVERLSQGQQRRLHLALCLASRPDLLVLDEPTNHLSATLVDEMTDALRTTEAAVMVVTHDRQMLRDLVGEAGDGAWPVLALE